MSERPGAEALHPTSSRAGGGADSPRTSGGPPPPEPSGGEVTSPPPKTARDKTGRTILVSQLDFAKGRRLADFWSKDVKEKPSE